MKKTTNESSLLSLTAAFSAAASFYHQSGARTTRDPSKCWAPMGVLPTPEAWISKKAKQRTQIQATCMAMRSDDVWGENRVSQQVEDVVCNSKVTALRTAMPHCKTWQSWFKRTLHCSRLYLSPFSCIICITTGGGGAHKSCLHP